MKSDFHIATHSVAAGSKQQLYLTVPDTQYELPVTIINGINTGATVVLTAGIHACEYPPIWAAAELAQQIAANELNGQLIIVHTANVSGFWQRRPFSVPEDGKNLNRVFPGSASGTLSERIAHFLMQEFISKTDFYVDMHSGDQPEGLTPYVYYPVSDDKRLSEQARNAAQHLAVGYMVGSSARGGAYNEAAQAGVPSLLIERGGMGLCPDADVAAYRADILNLLRLWGMLAGTAVVFAPQEIKEAIYLQAEVDGCWRSAVKPGERICCGQRLGAVYDVFGRLQREYTAAADGVVLYCWSALAVSCHNYVVAYGRLE